MKLSSSKLLRGHRDRSPETVVAGNGVSMVRQNCLPTCIEKGMAV